MVSNWLTKKKTGLRALELGSSAQKLSLDEISALADFQLPDVPGIVQMLVQNNSRMTNRRVRFDFKLRLQDIPKARKVAELCEEDGH